MMNMSKNKLIWSVVGVAFIALVVWLIVTPGKPGKLDAFATCLKDRDVKFYGAFWCPHCQAQKALFGNSSHLLPYIECSNPDQSQNQLCTNNGIMSYPTWVFQTASGTATTTGEQTLAELSDKTKCELPQ
jgi:hypothetical protein